MFLIVLLCITVQTALGQQGSAEETGDPTDSGDLIDVTATFGPQVKLVAYGLVFVALCLLSISVPDAPMLLFVCSMPIVQFRGLRVALALLQCAIVFARGRSLRSLLPSWPLLVFLLCITASSSWALDPGASFLSESGGVLDTLSLVPLIFATRAVLQAQLTTTQRLLSALSFGCIPGCVLIIYNALSGVQWRGEAGYRMALLRPDIFSPLLVVSGLFLLFCITSSAIPRIGKLAALCFLPLICLSLLLTGIRSGWLAVGLGGFFWLLQCRSVLAWAGALAVSALMAFVALGAAASLNLDEQLASRLSERSLQTGGTRLELWEVAARGFMQRPILGIGWSCFPGFAADNTVGREIVAHNIFVRILCELGFVGFGVFMTWIAMMISKFRRSSQRGLMGLLMIGVLAQGLFLDLFVCTYFYFFLGMCEGIRADLPSPFSYWLGTANWSLPKPINKVAI